ncbi:retrovirus-related pol polyprotein from transposon TNT 1-94 [Tanacetum coccineum]
MFDEYFESSTVDSLVPPAPVAQAPVNLTGPSVSIPINQEAPSGSHSPSSSDHQSSSVHQGVVAEHLFEVNPSAAADPEPFVNVFAPDHNSEASSSGVIARTESNQTTQPHEHLQKWIASHPIDNIIRNPSRPVFTRKQLATDALWCFYNSVLSKVEPKNFKSAVTEDCWFQAMQDEIHEFDRLDVWELVPPPDCAMIIALKWIYKLTQMQIMQVVTDTREEEESGRAQFLGDYLQWLMHIFNAQEVPVMLRFSNTSLMSIILTVTKWVLWEKANYFLDVGKKNQANPIFKMLWTILKKPTSFKAFTLHPSFLPFYILSSWDTIDFDKDKEYNCQLDEHGFYLTKLL